MQWMLNALNGSAAGSWSSSMSRDFYALHSAEWLQVLQATHRSAGADCFVFANISACAMNDVHALTRGAQCE